MYAHEVHARKIHAHKMHAREIHAHKMHARKMHAHKMHAREVHACKMHVYKVHAHEMHACEVHAYEIHAYKMQMTPMQINTPQYLKYKGVLALGGINKGVVPSYSGRVIISYILNRELIESIFAGRA
jgi:hypothetical protein